MRPPGWGSRRPLVGACLALLLALFVALPAHPALGDPQHDDPPPATTPPEDDHEEMIEEPTRARLKLRVPAQASLGERVPLEAVLRSATGEPIEGASVSFFLLAAWGETPAREVAVGTGVTDASGSASVVTDARREGELSYLARYSGDETYDEAETSGTVSVDPGDPLYVPDVGIDVPGGVWWLLIVVAAVWGLYLLVARQVIGIARAADTDARLVAEGQEASGSELAATTPRRRFLTRWLVPAGLTAAVASIGSGLLALVSRSPRTHSNQQPYGWAEGARHRRTSIARVGTWKPSRPLPPVLEREVSFSREVLPILMTKGGPHTHVPAHSPPPHGVRLDGYEQVMVGNLEAEDQPHAHRIVVPGKPEDSMLVKLLVDAAHQMPPIVPLSEQEIQLIASWVAQGANDN